MENKINIQITVDDEQFKSLITDQLQNLPDDKLQEIFSEAMTEFLKSDKGSEIFYEKSWHGNITPSRLLTTMVSNAVSKDLLKPCVDEFIKGIVDNSENIIKTAIVNTFTNLFFTQLKESTLQDEIYRNVYTMVNEKRN